MGVSINKQGIVSATCEAMEVTIDDVEETIINGFVEPDSNQSAKIYKNYIEANNFIEL